MIDLTPLDIRKKKADFTRVLRGYEPREVNHFLDTVAERLEEVVKVNLTLREQVTQLAERVQGQEGRERAVQEALVTAQSLKHDIEEQAKREAELIRQDAESAADNARREAESAADNLRRDAESSADTVRREAESAAENAREAIQGIIAERRRELVELNLARTRFLNSFRSLLERELDAVEVAENSPGSDELDLDVLQFGRATTRPEGEDSDSGVLEPEGQVTEVTIELTEAPDAAGIGELEDAAAVGSDEEVSPAASADGERSGGEVEVQLDAAEEHADVGEEEGQVEEDRDAAPGVPGERSGRASRERVSAGDAGDSGSAGEEERWGVR